MTESLGSLLLVISLALMAARTISPIAAPVTGKSVADLPINLMFRLLDQRINIMAILAVLILGSGILSERWVSHGMFLFTVIVMIGLLLVPRQYRVTTDGISPSRAIFRRWDEFTDWDSSGNVIRLKGADRFAGLTLYATGHDRDRLIALIAARLPKASTERSLVNVVAAPPRRLTQRKGGAK